MVLVTARISRTSLFMALVGVTSLTAVSLWTSVTSSGLELLENSYPMIPRREHQLTETRPGRKKNKKDAESSGKVDITKSNIKEDNKISEPMSLKRMPQLVRKPRLEKVEDTRKDTDAAIRTPPKETPEKGLPEKEAKTNMDSKKTVHKLAEAPVPKNKRLQSENAEKIKVYNNVERPATKDKPQTSHKNTESKHTPPKTTTKKRTVSTFKKDVEPDQVKVKKATVARQKTPSTVRKEKPAPKKETKAVRVTAKPKAAKEVALPPKVDLRLFENDRKQKLNRPPLQNLIKDESEGIKTDVNFMMDWAILGHAKCATSFLSQWLNKHPEIQSFKREVCDLYDHKPALLVKKLYQEFPSGDFKRGFKCPGHFSRQSLKYFRTHFQKTRLVVGLRHPVLWFESYYNFRARHGEKLPEPSVNECTPEMQGICTRHAHFHVNLAKFGKTNISNPDERTLLHLDAKYKTIPRVENPVFVYHSSQLYDSNTTRFEQFRTDFKDFLGVKQPMANFSRHVSSRTKFKAMDICEPKHDALREELIRAGTRASPWIRRYFLDSPSVFYSDRAYLESLLREFPNDPCKAKNKEAYTSSD